MATIAGGVDARMEERKEALPMVMLLALLLLLILLFGGLGVFVAKVFLIGIIVVLLAGFLGGFLARGSLR